MEEASRTAAAFEDKTTLWGAVASWFALELERSSLSVFVGETQLKEVCKVISEAFVDSIRKKGRKPLYFATRPSPYDDDVLPADKINSLLKKWGSVLEPSVVRNAILEARKGLSKAFSSAM